MTKNGQIILDTINNVYCHPNAEEVLQLVRDGGHKMSMATVYNNLNSLSQEGLIRRLTTENQPDRFDKMLRHDHAICKNCGKLKDVFIKDLSQEIQTEAGFQIESYDLKITYICEECKESNSK